MSDDIGRRSPPPESAGSPLERAVEWVLLDGRREFVAAGIAGLFFVFFAAVVAAGPVPLLDVQALFYVFSGAIAGNLTLITVVVSINQLLLSRELKTPGELREQIDNVVTYREEVEAATGEVAPVQPMGFLRLLVESTREDAQRLGGLARDGLAEPAREAIDEEVTTLTDQMDEIDAVLQASDTGTINVLSTLLETNYARDINGLRRIEAEYGEELPESALAAIGDVVDRLQDIDVARQYFKSIYFQQELSTLSRILLYTGLPAVAVAVSTLLVLTVPSDAPGAAADLRLLLPVSLAIATLPLSVLASYILRTATVTTLTAATLPFTTPEQER